MLSLLGSVSALTDALGMNHEKNNPSNETCQHLLKEPKSTITFTVNGTQYHVGSDHHPASSLLEYLRKEGVSVGTKGCCYEGGCGVCLVTVKYLDPLTGKLRVYAVNSCCLQLYTCDGLEVTTIEGLGDTRTGLHPIQERLAIFDGVQCGYCTPGQVMNMYGILQNNPKPTMQEIEDAYDATICRCTGYRPILDAMKSFASDAPASLRQKGGVIDIEELEGKLCKKTGKACAGHCNSHGQISDGADCSSRVSKPLHIVTAQAQWFKPMTLAELCHLLKVYAGQRYRLVYGNTGFGVFRDVGPWNFKVLIDIRGVQELYMTDLSPADHVIFGANVSLTTLKEAFEKTTDPGLPYANVFVAHLGLVASSSIRNLSSWAGNLALKNGHNDFVSDVFTLLETVGTQVTVVDGDGKSKQYLLTDFLSLDLKGKVIVSMRLPKYTTSDVAIRTFKTSHRLQLCHAHVTSGFNFQVDPNHNYLVKTRPTIVIQGINGQLVHAVKTENFLLGRKLGDSSVLQGAISLLSEEIVPDDHLILASPDYRKSLAIGHFYKFVLGVCGNSCTSRYLSGGHDLCRPLMTGTQDYGTDDSDVYPATKPLMKLTAFNLATGEIKFVSDLAPRQGQLYAALVLSTQGNAKIQSIDASMALKIPGVVRFIQASDIPGVNDWRPHAYYAENENQELLCSQQVLYAGQPLGILLAEDEVTAQSSRFGVKVTYIDIQPAITSVEEAMRKHSFFEKIGPITKGDAATAMAKAPHRVKGAVHSTDQYNFHLENQAALCIPTDTGGMDVIATSQWLDACSQTVSQVLGLPESSITVETQRLGGGFGGKIFYSPPMAGMCAVAAYVTRRPVLLNLDLHTNMQFQGKRTYYVYDYEVGFDDDGKILAIIATGYSDTGALFFPPDGNEYTEAYIDSVYACPNWSWSVQPCKTNKPLSTAVRAPGSAPAIFGMECMIDHVATYLKKDHLEVRKINFLRNGDVTLAGVLLEHCLISDVVAQLATEIQIADRVRAVSEFNKANRWRKRGFHVMPNRYPMFWHRFCHTVSVNINHGDGSVSISHGGIDMGQGINTKAIQCCAYKLGVPMDQIKVKNYSTTTSTNSNWTAGSTTSELICFSIMKCCEDLLQRMAPSKAKLVNPTWRQFVKQAHEDLVDLRANYMPQIEDKYPAAHYSCWSACATEVELDVLTGQYQVLQVDFLNDTGFSLNPRLDMGQLEGGFILGCGLFLLEGMKFDPVSGRALNHGTWEYKPPLGKDLPIKFNAKFLRNAPNPSGVLSSKAVGEAPVSTGSCVLFALKRAVEAARLELGHTEWFPFHAPASVENIHTACLNDIAQYTFGD
ncbi:hypothetical protein BsWGS_07946 [Bradybaena similaris]